MVCVVYFDTVSVRLITAQYGGYGCRSKLIMLSEVPQGSVLGTLLFLLYNLELFSFLEKKLIGYTDCCCAILRH